MTPGTSAPRLRATSGAIGPSASELQPMTPMQMVST